MAKTVYLDNAATSPALPVVAEAVQDALLSTYGNPSSLHLMGMRAEVAVKSARRSLAGFLGVPEREVFFTSGGTEADNLAVLGAARKMVRRGKHVVTTAIEHAAVLGPCHALEQEGYHVTYVGVDAQGRVSPAAVADAVREDTILVSVMTVNNETGAIQPISDIAQAVRSKNRRCYIHTDAVQALGKIDVDLVKWGIDLASFSAHKVHGPKGCGALWVRDGVNLEPLVYGGGQEHGIRSGTENVPGVVGFGTAVAALAADWRNHRAHMASLRNRFIQLIEATLPQVVFHGPMSDNAAPHICSFSLPNLRGEVTVHALAQAGVYVSSGAACSSHHQQHGSHVLQAMGVAKSLLTGSLRVSLSQFTTADDIEQAADALAQVIRTLCPEQTH